MEFAILAPVLLGMIIGVVEFAMVVFVSVLLEGSIREAARFGATGQDSGGAPRLDQIAQVVSDNLFGLVTIQPSDIDVYVYPDFDEIVEREDYTDSDGSGDYTLGESFVDRNANGVWDAGNGTAGAGGPGEVVVYRVTADWSMYSPLIGRMLDNQGLFRLTSSIAVRNEPFEE